MSSQNKRKWKYKAGSQWTKKQKTINSAQDENSGFLFTCSTSRQREAKRDAFNLLHQAAEDLDEAANSSSSASSSSSSSSTTTAAATAASASSDDDGQNDGMDLAAEIAALKDGSATMKSRFTPINVTIKGVFVIVLSPQEKHSSTDYVSQLCATAIASGQLSSRFLSRAYPLGTICRSREKDLSTTLIPLLTAFFQRRVTQGAPLPWSFAIDYKGRYMGKKFRNAAIAQLADTVAEQHAVWSSKSTMKKETDKLSVDLNHPEFVVLCQAFSPLCGITVVDGDEYRKCGKYNLTKLQGVSVVKNKADDQEDDEDDEDDAVGVKSGSSGGSKTNAGKESGSTTVKEADTASK